MTAQSSRHTGDYFKSNIWDFVLCVAIVCSINVTIYSGFYIADYLQYSYPILIGLTAALNLLLFFAAYNKRNILIGIGVFLAAAALFIVYAQQHTAEGIFADNESNPYLYYIISVISIIAVFLLTRTKIGTGIMFVAGILLLGAIQFLYEQGHLIPLLLFIVACGTMYVYKNYRQNVLKSHTIKVAFGRTTVIAAVLCACVVGLSIAAYSGIVHRIDPPTKDLKLITEYMALPTLEQLGIADITEVPDYDKETNKKNDQTEGAKQRDKKTETKDGINDNKDKESDIKNNPNILDSLRNAFFYVVNYLVHGYGWLVILIVVVVAIATAILLKLYLRKKWLKDLSLKSNEAQVMEMYRFYLARFRKLKIRKPPEDTLFQFVSRAKPLLGHFSGGGVDFAALTAFYVRANYGEGRIEREELMAFRIFHAQFYTNCRCFLGRFKYALKFFTL